MVDPHVIVRGVEGPRGSVNEGHFDRFDIADIAILVALMLVYKGGEYLRHLQTNKGLIR